MLQKVEEETELKRELEIIGVFQWQNIFKTSFLMGIIF